MSIVHHIFKSEFFLLFILYTTLSTLYFAVGGITYIDGVYFITRWCWVTNIVMCLLIRLLFARGSFEHDRVAWWNVLIYTVPTLKHFWSALRILELARLSQLYRYEHVPLNTQLCMNSNDIIIILRRVRPIVIRLTSLEEFVMKITILTIIIEYIFTVISLFA